MDERSLTQDLARFNGFRKNIPPAIRENVVNEYHSIVDALATATGEDLTPFKIRPDELKHKVVGARRGPFSGGRGSVTYSSDRYCDDSRFQAQVDSLAEYLESAGHRRRSGGRNEAPKIVPLTIPVSDSFISSSDEEDRKFAQLAVEEARKSVPEDGRVHPKVGVVVVKEGRILAKAHRGEFPQCHAEFIALEKKLEDKSLLGATVYTTLEPCTSRNHPKIPCANRLVERKVARVVIGMLDPDNRISGQGQRTLRKAGVITDLFPPDLMAEVEDLNREFTRDRDFSETKTLGQVHFVPDAHNNGWAIQSEEQMEVRLGGMFTYDGPGTLIVLQAFVEETRLTTDMMVQVITRGGFGQAVSVPHLSLDSRTPVRAVINLRLTPVRGTRGETLNSRVLFRDNYNQDYPFAVSLPYVGQR